MVGIAQPYGMGFGNVYEHARIDFSLLEGFWTGDVKVMLTDSIIDGSCIAPNARTINTGQDRAAFAGICTQYFSTGVADVLDNVYFTDNPGFGPTFKTADILSEDLGSTVTNAHGASYQLVNTEGIQAGGKWDSLYDGGKSVTGPTPNVMGQSLIFPADTSPINYTGFTGMQVGQDVYIAGGNSNVTIATGSGISWITTCSGENINLGTVSGFLHFHFGGNGGTFGNPNSAQEVCVTRSSTPSYTTVTLTGAITNSTQAATKAYVDTAVGAKLPLAGGTLTGALILNADPAVALGAATKQYVDAHIATPSTIASSETVSFSTAPTFSTSTRSSIITMTANIVTFTLAAGTDGQEKTLIFCQNATGGFTVGNPTNVHGFMTVGTTASKCNAQHYTYSSGQSAWLADSAGVINE
jgi:hypothetical protein